MTVYKGDIEDKIVYAPPLPYVNSMDNHNVEIKKEGFLDYFPLTRSSFSGYIEQATFRNKLDQLIAETLRAVRKDTYYYTETLPPAPRSYLGVNSETGNAIPKSDADYRYYADIQNTLAKKIWEMEWREIKELHYSDAMYAEASNYMKTAVLDIATAVVSDKVTDKLSKPAKHKFGNTLNKMTNPKSKMNKIIGKGIGGNVDYSFSKHLGAKFNFHYSTIDQIIGIPVQVGQNFAYNIATTQEEKTYSGETISSFGDGELAQAVDIVTDFVPWVSYCKTGVKSTLNLALGAQLYITANRMRKMENESNFADENFNRKIMQNLESDIRDLSLKEVEQLINLLNNDK
jgi:hypothetical protein